MDSDPSHERVLFLNKSGEFCKVNGMKRKGRQDTFDVISQGDHVHLGTLKRTATDSGLTVWMTKENTGCKGGLETSDAAPEKIDDFNISEVDHAASIIDLFKPLKINSGHPLSFDSLKRESDEEWAKWTRDTEMSLSQLPTYFLKECLVPATPLVMMCGCAYMAVSMANNFKPDDPENSIAGHFPMIAALVSGAAMGGVVRAFSKIVDNVVLSHPDPSRFRKLSHQEAARTLFSRYSKRFESHIEAQPAAVKDNIRTTALAVESMLKSDTMDLAKLKIGLERYLIEIAFSAMARVDVATYGGNIELQKQSNEEFEKFLSLYPDETQKGLILLNQHVEDVSKCDTLDRRNFFLQSDKTIAAFGGMGKSLAIKAYCRLKGKTLVKFSISEKGLWHLTGMYNNNVRFDFSIEHNESLAPLIFEVMKTHDAAPIVFFEEAGEAVANSQAHNSRFNHAALKELSDPTNHTLKVSGWGGRELDISGWTIVAAGNIDITDNDETAVGKTPAAVARRWDPIFFYPFEWEQKSNCFDLTVSHLKKAFKQNGKMPEGMLSQIFGELDGYREFIIENDNHPGASGVMRATDRAARYIRSGHEKNRPFTNFEIQCEILVSLKQVEQVKEQEHRASELFTRRGHRLADGMETISPGQAATPEAATLRSLLAASAEQRRTAARDAAL